MKYFYKLLILALIVFIGYGIYGQVNKNSPKASRLSCQKNTIFFERVLDKDMIKKTQIEFQDSHYVFTISKEESKYMKSRLFQYVDIDEVKNYFLLSSKTTINTNLKPEDGVIDISLHIYENDKNDPGKKTKKSKLYAGYIILGVKTKIDGRNHAIYRAQVDFMDLEGKDIHKRIDCLIKSFMSLDNL